LHVVVSHSFAKSSLGPADPTSATATATAYFATRAELFKVRVAKFFAAWVVQQLMQNPGVASKK